MLLLEEIFTIRKAEYSEPYTLRVTRSLSWLKQALALPESSDLKLLSLWISLQAICVPGSDEPNTQQPDTLSFLQRLLLLDHEAKLQQNLWGRLYPVMEQFLQSPYTQPYYWAYRHRKITRQQWQQYQQEQQQLCEQVLRHKKTVELLPLLVERLAQVHQQLLQGGRSCNSQFQAQTLELACRLLSTLMPVLIGLMLEHGQFLEEDAQPFYPQPTLC